MSDDSSVQIVEVIWVSLSISCIKSKLYNIYKHKNQINLTICFRQNHGLHVSHHLQYLHRHKTHPKAGLYMKAL